MTIKIDKFYHVPLRKVHLAYLDGVGSLVVVCNDTVVIVTSCGDSREAMREDAEYWDRHNQPVTCKRCLRWRGI